MTRVLESKHNWRMGYLFGQPNGHFTFKGDDNTFYNLSELFGRTTTWNAWYRCLTREIGGKTWWLLKPWEIINVAGNPNYVAFRYMDEKGNKLGTGYASTIVENKMIYDTFTTSDDRALILVTDEKTGKSYTEMAVREDSKLWDVYYGDLPSGGLLPIVTVKEMDKRIDDFLYITLPRREQSRLNLEQARESESVRFYGVNDLPLPSRYKNKSQYNLYSTINGINHNVNAIIKLLKQKGVL